MFSPDPIHAGWEVSNGFCVAGAAILMPLRWSPLTLYMLVGKCQMAFVWQVQQFRCLWDVLPWPYTCWLGSVKWLLCGRCSNFDASEMISPDPIHACWEGSNGFCVAGATISMPLRWFPLTLYMLVGKGQMAFVWQVPQLWCLWDDLPWPYTCLLGRVKWLLCGRCNNFDASEMFSPDPIHAGWEMSNGFCVAGAAILMPLRWSPLTLYMLVGKCQMAFVWQVQQFWCLWDVLPWPYTCWLGSVKWLLCGRCNNFDASEMFSPDPIHAGWEVSNGFCVAGAAILMPLRWSPLTLYMLVGKCQMAFVWQVQQFRCLWDDFPWPYTCLLGRVKWLLCGRCNNCDASGMISPDPIHACWEGSNGFCVAGAAILMPLRWSPLTLYMLVGRVKWLLCGRCHNFDASEMISPDPIHAGWEGSNGFCVAGATIVMPLRWSPLTLYMLVGKGQMAFVWQVQQFRCLCRGGGNCDKSNVFDKRNVVVESMGCRGGGGKLW